MFRFILILFCLFSSILFSQNIKTVQLRALGKDNQSTIVPLGTILEFSFDDLEADVKDYQYKIEHMTHDWQKSKLLASQFIDGFDQNTIIDVTNSFNTFQSYSHYSVKIPNINTVITKSGNYLISVLDSYDNVIFSRKFVYYEELTNVGVAVSRSRNTKTLDTQQTLEFFVSHPKLRINNPQQELNIVLIKNENWGNTITNLQPTFFQQNLLKYTYSNKTNFNGGNEYLNFDSKIIRNKSVNIVKVEQKNRDVFHHYIYPYEYKSNSKYSYNPDINGQFIIRTLEGNDSSTEADYAMMHFTLNCETPFLDKEVYIYGAFNNFGLETENKMQYDFSEKAYKGKVLLKQGFYNYKYVTLNKYDELNEDEILGNFFQTENEYKVIVYFKASGSLYDRVVGIGTSVFNADK